jgi:hypothetical protein
MNQVVFHSLYSWLLKKLPALIIKPLFSVERIKKDFEVDLASQPQVALWLSPPVPWIEVALRFTNKSPAPVLVDRILFRIKMGYHIMDAASLEILSIQSKETKSESIRLFLSGLQRDVIKGQFDESSRLRFGCQIAIAGFCECKLGSFKVVREFTLQGNAIPIN